MAANRSTGSSGDDFLRSLIPIIILFCIPAGFTQLIGLFLLLKLAFQRNWFQKLGFMLRSGTNYSGAHTTAPQDGWQRVQEQPTGQSSAASRTSSGTSGGSRQAAAAQPQAAAQSAPKVRKVGHPGLGLIIGGAVTSGIFSLGTFATFLEFVRYRIPDDLVGLLACTLFLAGGLGMLFSGIGKNRRAERYATYLAYIGANREVDLARMSANLDVPVKTLCKDLRKMLSKGYLPTGYVDLAEGKLFLTETGYRPVEREEPEAEEEPVRTVEDEDAILKEIRQVNDFIPDEVMSEKIDRIEEITRKILAYQKKHPERAGQLRSFLNYYLPTTLKILRAYAQLDAQGVEGENISAAKGRIEGMMDQVVYGFEKQLDKLFQEDAMDVAADVEVLENMLRKDGLSDGQGMTLGI